MVDLNALDDSLRGKVRGNPVAVSLFYSEIPEEYEKKKVVPCSILRHAMDKGEVVSFDRDHHDCTTGVYTCLLYTSPSPRDVEESRMPSSA